MAKFIKNTTLVLDFNGVIVEVDNAKDLDFVGKCEAMSERIGKLAGKFDNVNDMASLTEAHNSASKELYKEVSELIGFNNMKTIKQKVYNSKELGLYDLYDISSYIFQEAIDFLGNPDKVPQIKKFNGNKKSGKKK